MGTNPASLQRRVRLACLDGLRGVLALAVVVIHVAQLLTYPPPAQAMVASLGDGGLAVAVFFVLSGLVIFTSIGSFQGQPGPFLLARAARIYPAFLVALAASLPLAPAATPLWVHLLAHLTMTHGLFPAELWRNIHLSILQPAWSLSTEFQFYIVIAALVALVGVRRWQLAGAFMALGLAGAWLGAAFTPALLVNEAQYFALGIATSSVFAAPTRRAWIGFALATLACLAVIGLQGALPRLLVPVGWAVIVGAQVWPRGPLRPLSAVLSSAALQWLGKVSYSLYLIHFPVLLLFARLWRPGAGASPALHWLWIVAYFAATLAASSLLQAYVEAPFNKIGHRYARSLLPPRGSERASVSV